MADVQYIGCTIYWMIYTKRKKTSYHYFDIIHSLFLGYCCKQYRQINVIAKSFRLNKINNVIAKYFIAKQSLNIFSMNKLKYFINLY